MRARSCSHERESRWPSWWRIPSWPIWSLPAPAQALVIAVIVAAYSISTAGLLADWPGRSDLVIAGLLIGLGIVHTEMAFGVEKYRATIPGRDDHTDLTSVWTFAAALLLPPTLAASTASVVHLHLCVRLRLSGGILYRQLYTNATVVLACISASLLLAATSTHIAGAGSFRQMGVIVLAMLIYTGVNTALLVVAVRLTTNVRRRWYGNDLLELVTLALGTVVAFILASDHSMVLAFLAPVLLLLHWTIAADELQRQSGIERTSGLANSAAWHQLARRELRRAIRRQHPIGILLIDIDNFRRVNEDYGHLIGNQVLDSVGEALSCAARKHDTLGLNGSDEFLALLPAVDEELPRIAARMVDVVANLEVTAQLEGGTTCLVDGLAVSIGGAQWPDDGLSSEDLLSAADFALQDAKRGRTSRVAYGITAKRKASMLAEYRSARMRNLSVSDGAKTADDVPS